jgi:segregation and condensation protein B
MTADETNSLADQAAAWVPPWARQPSAAESGPASAEDGPTPAEDASVESGARDLPDETPIEPIERIEPEDESGPVSSEGVTASDVEAGESDVPEDIAPVDSPELPDEMAADRPLSSQQSGESDAAIGILDDEVQDVPVPGSDVDAGAVVVPDESDIPNESPATPETLVDAAPQPADEVAAQTALPIGDEPKAELTDDELRGAVEAILLIIDEPATEIVLAQVLDQPVDRISGVLALVSREYTEMGRGFELRRVAGGWRLYTRPEYAAYVEKFVLDGQQVRLTQAALETLAVVAYKQPVTRSRISAIRGVNCDGVVRTLVARGLIEECGSEPESGAFLYRTTILFLEKLGLDSVEQLPPLAPFLPDDVDEIADAQR